MKGGEEEKNRAEREGRQKKVKTKEKARQRIEWSVEGGIQTHG